MGWRREHGRRERSMPKIEACQGDVLYYRHRREWYRVNGVNETGIVLHRDGIDFYMSCSLFIE